MQSKSALSRKKALKLFLKRLQDGGRGLAFPDCQNFPANCRQAPFVLGIPLGIAFQLRNPEVPSGLRKPGPRACRVRMTMPETTSHLYNLT